jgi:hypothetical protein
LCLSTKVSAWIEIIWDTKHTFTSLPSDPLHCTALIHPW